MGDLIEPAFRRAQEKARYVHAEYMLAAAVMPAIAVKYQFGHDPYEQYAREAYAVADAMMRVRDQFALPPARQG